MGAKYAFNIGVVGRLALEGDSEGDLDPGKLTGDAALVRQRVFGLLDWVRSGGTGTDGPGHLDLHTGAFEQGVVSSNPPWWRPLGLGHTPIVILSRLAPGA
ncbi:MAG: hypothetical protein KDB61_14125, partial [Planctomycetes bacterium]|nr:hypothetical protein [Planctomycetota bacterium]